MKLSTRIEQAGLSREIARTFDECLRRVAGADGTVCDDEARLIQRLLRKTSAGAGASAPLDAAWPHSELLLTACLYVAVADGHYGVEEARAISEYAHRLGFSARQLGDLESRVFAELKAQAATAKPRS